MGGASSTNNALRNPDVLPPREEHFAVLTQDRKAHVTVQVKKEKRHEACAISLLI